MPKVYANRSARKAPRRRRIVKKAIKRPTFAAKVKKVIKSQAEHKITEYTGSGAFYNYNAASTNFNANIIPISPYSGLVTIVQGTRQGDRIGNMIRPVKCYIKMALWPKGYDATTNPNPVPQDVRIIVLKSKEYTNTVLGTSALGNLFQFGGASMGMSGAIGDLLQDINKDVYTVYYDKVFKIGYASNAGTGSVANNQSYTNNDYKMNKILKIDATKWVSKIIRFNDSNNAPEIPCIQLVVIPLNSNGASAGASSQPLGYTYNVGCMFTDE